MAHATIHQLDGIRRRQVECLACGQPRAAHPHRAGECPRCGYLGWAYADDLSETERRALRDNPLPARRPHLRERVLRPPAMRRLAAGRHLRSAPAPDGRIGTGSLATEARVPVRRGTPRLLFDLAAVGRLTSEGRPLLQLGPECET